jgi:ferredoxin
VTAVWLLERVGADGDQPVRLLDRGFCDRCPTGGPEHPAAGALGEAERVLDALDVPAERRPKLVYEPLALRRMELRREEPVLEERLSRRSFLTGLSRATPLFGAIGADATSAPGAPEPQVRRRFAALKRLAPGQVLPASLFPRLTASADCANHRLCVAACPTGAIQEYRVDDARGVRVDAAACVACGLCTQLCPGQALTLHPAGDAAEGYAGPQPLTRFALHTCPACDAEYEDQGPVCPACLKDRSFARDAFRTLFGAAAR